MSAMKQFGAALMRSAPITGTAYAAYNEIANFNKNDNQGNRDKPRETNPATNPSTENPDQKPTTNPSPSSTPAGPGGDDAPQKAGGMYVDSSTGTPNTENTAVQGYEGTASPGDNSEPPGSEPMPEAVSSAPSPAPSPMPRSGDVGMTNSQAALSAPSQMNPSAPTMRYQSLSTTPRSGGGMTNPQANSSAPSVQYRSPSAQPRPTDSITNNFGKPKRRKFLQPPK